MTLFRRLFEHYRAYHAHGLSRLKYMGYVGAIAFTLFYLLRFTWPNPQLFDDRVLHLVAVVLLAGLALVDHWPDKARPYYIGYSYLVVLYCLPCITVLVALQRGGDVPAISNSFIALFFLVLLTDWRNTLGMLLAGTGIAAAIYVANTPDPKLPMGLVAQLPAFALIVIGGNVFRVFTEQIDADRKLRATALAGSIAHEMRNSLSQIRYNLEGMEQALPPPTSTQAQTLGAPQIDTLYRRLAESEMAVKRGLQVIAMILDEVSAKPVDTSAFSYLCAAATTEKAVQEYAFASEAERSRVRVHVIEDFDFRADETAYLFVLFNLIKNALYCIALDPGARITVTVADQQVKVHDTGPGIAPDALARLFQPFASVGKVGGTGLGLAYCRRVMRAFDGEIECESVLGEYTEFTLRFPKVDLQESQSHHLAVMDRARAAFAGKRLLVVDDDAGQRKATRSKLAALGVQIDEAIDGHRALEALARYRYDLVLLDLRMPVLDGYAVAAEVRQGQVPLNSEVRIVAYSSEPAHVASVKAQKAGMDGFVSKPCEQLPLVEALHQALDPSASSTRRPANAPADSALGCFSDAAAVTPTMPAAMPPAPDPKGRLLDVHRLESYRRIGMLEALLEDYTSEIGQLVERLEQGVADQDLARALDALHSLLGTSGDAGASALHRLVRTIYVPMVEARSWPAQLGWLEQISATTNQTQAALKAYAGASPAV